MDHALQIRKSNPRFFKVPAQQRRANKEVFDFSIFSFGPYHAGAACLRDGEHFKRLAATDLLASDGLKGLAVKIQQHKAELRDLYIQMSEPLPHRVEDGNPLAAELAEVLALDSILIVRIALRINPPLAFFIESAVMEDALLLENQVPIFVLKYALESLRWNNIPMKNVLKLFCTWVNPFKPFSPSLEPEVNDKASLLAYVYDYFTETGRPATSSSQFYHESCVLSTASRLARCGLRFRPSNSSFRGVEFHEKTLELCLPRIVVGDDTLRLLHNLLAYEATSRDELFPVVSYFHIMNCLIDTEEDVQVLVEAGVIENLHGSRHKLASSWSRLGTGVCFSTTESDRETIRRVEMLTKKRWRTWRAAFKEKYWEKQPWLGISVIAATILLVVTLVQTIYTIKDSGSSRH